MNTVNRWLILGGLLFALTGCESLTPYQKMYGAIREGDATTVDEMVKTNFRAGVSEEHWLPDAAARDRVDIVAMLLDAGYKIDTMDAYQETALHRAVVRGNVDMVKLLLKHNANPNIMNDCGEIPLGLADVGAFSTDANQRSLLGFSETKESYVQISRLLKAQGAKYNVVTECGVTPLLKMASNEKCHYYHEGMARSYQYDIKATDCGGNTAYHYATSKNLQTLLESKGANPNIKNKQGYTPAAYWQVLRGNAQAAEQFRAEKWAKEQADLERKQAEQDARDRADMRNVRESMDAAKNPCGFAYSCTLGQGSEAKTYVNGKRVLSGKDVEECRLHPNAAFCN